MLGDVLIVIGGILSKFGGVLVVIEDNLSSFGVFLECLGIFGSISTYSFVVCGVKRPRLTYYLIIPHT